MNIIQAAESGFSKKSFFIQLTFILRSISFCKKRILCQAYSASKLLWETIQILYQGNFPSAIFLTFSEIAARNALFTKASASTLKSFLE